MREVNRRVLFGKRWWHLWIILGYQLWTSLSLWTATWPFVKGTCWLTTWSHFRPQDSQHEGNSDPRDPWPESCTTRWSVLSEVPPVHRGRQFGLRVLSFGGLDNQKRLASPTTSEQGLCGINNHSKPIHLGKLKPELYLWNPLYDSKGSFSINGMSFQII